MTTALITGASQGLGRALAASLADDGWRVVVDARHADVLLDSAQGHPGIVALAGDVTDERHRAALAEAVGDRLDLLVLNASTLGPTPLPELAGYDLAELRRVLEVNLVAPLALVQATLPALRAAGGQVVALSSDAAVAGYEGWGAYGASKAALDQLIRVFGAEQPQLAAYAVDPGDMRTAMHQAAFPGEDISDRPTADSVIPALRNLISHRRPSGRYVAADLVGAR
ncbi:MAG TPA: SDR family oxidoreductase [Mycobacteriales bacterium]|jgi:NAD(P)-dependent dehydrogenase (short-subunit alcohol dehydrogenase family)|nr:SDR family oxidoreductase [Mycobacteriales bacterium]